MSLTYEEDEMLIEGLRSGNRQSFDKLYRAYAPALLGYIERIVDNRNSAEKVLQKAFVEIWNNRQQYDADKERLFIWLQKQAKKTAVQYLALKQKKSAGKIQNTVKTVNIFDISNKEEHEIHKKVLELLHYKNYSLMEAATIMNINEDKVKCLLRCAIKNLKNLTR